MGTRVCWIKLNGWPDAFNERLRAIAATVDELVLIKPANNDPDDDPPDTLENVTVLDLSPSRDPVLSPRSRVLLYPVWVIQAVIVYFLYAARANGVDVFHAVDYPFGALTGRLLSLVTGTPQVVSVRGLPTAQFEGGKTRRSRVFNAIAEKILVTTNWLALRGADYVITKSSYQQDYLTDRYGITDAPMRSIPTGVDYEEFDPGMVTADGSFLQTLSADIPTDQPVVLQLGQIVQRKGAERFIDFALAYDGDPCHFLLVGETKSEDYRRRLEQLIATGDADRVTLYDDWVPFEDIPRLLAAVDVVSLLSTPGHEGVPRVLQEACVMETPIVASDVDGIRDVFADREGCFLVDRDDADAFEAAIMAALKTKPDRDNFASQLDIHHNYRQYSEIYTELAVP